MRILSYLLFCHCCLVVGRFFWPVFKSLLANVQALWGDAVHLFVC